MALFDNVIYGSEYDLIPGGDSAGNPPPGEETAAPLEGNKPGSQDPQNIELWPNVNIEDTTPRIEPVTFPGVSRDDLPRVTQRILSTMVILSSGSQPWQAFPADNMRELLIIDAIDITDTMGGTSRKIQPVVIAGSENECFNAGQTGPFTYTTSLPWRIRKYTGPLWIYLPQIGSFTATNPVRVTCWSFTY